MSDSIDDNETYHFGQEPTAGNSTCEYNIERVRKAHFYTIRYDEFSNKLFNIKSRMNVGILVKCLP